MSLLLDLLEEGTDKKQKQWREAQKKYHSKKKRSGKKEIRTFVTSTTKNKLQKPQGGSKKDMGSAIDKEVRDSD